MGDWDVSAVTNMGHMFSGASAFNQDLSKWDVSAVTNMMLMFSGASSFNQDLSKWDVSAVTDMRYMFWGANAFNCELCGYAWVNSRANKEHMFTNSSAWISSRACTPSSPSYGEGRVTVV